MRHNNGQFTSKEVAERNLKHGHAIRGKMSREYEAFRNAKRRCVKNHPDRRYYANRGIKFRFKSFLEFLNHIGPKPSPELTLDRINNDGHYEPGNVRWATRSQQVRNCRKRRMTNKLLRACRKRMAYASMFVRDRFRRRDSKTGRFISDSHR